MKILNLLSVIVISLSTVSTVSAENFRIMTEEYPPFNYTEGRKILGLSTEVVLELAKRVGHHTDIEVLPWARAYGLIQKKDGMILYSMTRTEQRENLFKWVGPVASNKWVLFARKGNGVTVGSLEDAKKVGKIGTYRDDAAELFLKEQGLTNLESVWNDEQNVPKLIAGRISLWIVGELQGFHRARIKGMEEQLEKVFEVLDTQLYIAFSRNTSDAEIARWQMALDAMKSDGSYDVIAKKYM